MPFLQGTWGSDRARGRLWACAVHRRGNNWHGEAAIPSFRFPPFDFSLGRLKGAILPRQAREKNMSAVRHFTKTGLGQHKRVVILRLVFSAGHVADGVPDRHGQITHPGEQKRSFCAIGYQNDHLTKTGSGQTQGKLKQNTFAAHPDETGDHEDR
jgi:hypothetical protein